MEPMVIRENPLAGLYAAGTHSEKLALIHRILRERCHGVDRISIALYDPRTETLRTFAASPIEESPLRNYEAVLDRNSSLADIVATGRPRVVNDLGIFADDDSVHSSAIRGHGFAASYTYPLFQHGALAGFVFFNSVHKDYFRERILEQVDIFSHLIAEMVLNDLVAIRSLVAALRTAVGMVHMRDPESGNHLERMARYSRLIAREMVRQGHCRLDDEQIEQIFHFAPLHDVGKIGIPDQILLKPGKLDDEEREVMNAHTMIGRQIVDELIENFGFDHLPYIDYLRNIAEQHHETVDGNGYPNGLQGESIALEARIVAVSDVFDALTSERPYKSSWSNDHAFSMLKLMAIDKLDGNCVEAMINCHDQVEEIQQRFADTAG